MFLIIHILKWGGKELDGGDPFEPKVFGKASALGGGLGENFSNTGLREKKWMGKDIRFINVS